MKALLLILSCFLVACGAHQAKATVLGGPLTNPANSHLYYLLATDTWTASETLAVSLGGHLATINDAAENSWVTNAFLHYGGTARELWIGFTDQSSEGNFVWTSGEPVTYSNWYPGQPDNRDGFTGEPEHYTAISSAISSFPPGSWKDTRNIGYSDPHGVVEVVPEPGSFALLLGGSAFLLAVRRLDKRRCG